MGQLFKGQLLGKGILITRTTTYKFDLRPSKRDHERRRGTRSTVDLQQQIVCGDKKPGTKDTANIEQSTRA